MLDLLTEIWESLRRNKLRTCLTGFAVSWGIFMIIVLLGAGNGLQNAFSSDSDDFASNTMEIYGGVTSQPFDGLKKGRRINLKLSDMALLEKEPFCRYVEKVTSANTQSGYTMSYGKYYTNDCTLSGVFEGYAELNRMELLAGRFINKKDLDEKRKVIVINHLVARTLLGGSTDYASLLGQRVKVGSFSFRIVGVRLGQENRNDRDIFLPYTTFRTIFGLDDRIDQITFTFHGLETEAENEEFEQRLRAAINTAHRAAPTDRSALWVWNQFTQNLQMEKGRGILNTGLWIVGLFTLLGGIVGVSNIMLITVKERTHEFGIRKAIGAKPWNIMKLIVSESVCITAVFGYVGMLLGMVACYVMDQTLGRKGIEMFGQTIQLLKNPTVGLDVALEVTLVLIVAGTLAGMAPAGKAAKVRPIEALNAN